MLKSMLLPAEPPRAENLAMVSTLATLQASSPTVRQAFILQSGQGVPVNKGTFQALVAPGMAKGRRGTARLWLRRLHVLGRAGEPKSRARRAISPGGSDRFSRIHSAMPVSQ